MAAQRPSVIVIGAGFSGLKAVSQLEKGPVDILVIDRHNFHLFTPLLYQVAASGLDPSDIAYPVRGVVGTRARVRFLLGTVEAIDTAARCVTVRMGERVLRERYDTLVLAAGSETNYFGMEQVERYGFALKTLADGVALRNHLLKCFEHAAWLEDPAVKRALTTVVVVGGGPTGLEMAGALRELYGWVLSKEFGEQLGQSEGRVILVEMQDHLLTPYPPRLRAAARRQLEGLGVEVLLGRRVVEAGEDYVTLDGGEVIPTFTLVWAAGVKPSPLAALLGVELHRSGAVPVLATLEVINCPDVYAVGDIAYLEDKTGQRYPMLIPPAQQQGKVAGKNILRRIRGQPQQPFRFEGLNDRGIMATIGRRRAVAWIFYKIQLTGYLAWLSWLTLHLLTLMGFRNRLSVVVNWVWEYLTYDRAVRIILEHTPHGALARGLRLRREPPSAVGPPQPPAPEEVGSRQ